MAIDFDEAIRRTQGSMEQREAKPPAEPPRMPKPTRPGRKLPSITLSYDELAGRGADIAGLLVWMALWCVDGWFTASFLSLLFGVSLWFGAGAHVVVSLVQHHLWRRNFRDNWPIILLFGAMNVSTSIAGIWAWLATRTQLQRYEIWDILTLAAPQSQALFYAGIVAGVAIALFPERKAAKHGASIKQQWR